MDRRDNELHIEIDVIDLVSIEREARALRARVMAEGIRAAWNWVAARLRRNPEGQTA